MADWDDEIDNNFSTKLSIKNEPSYSQTNSVSAQNQSIGDIISEFQTKKGVNDYSKSGANDVDTKSGANDVDTKSDANDVDTKSNGDTKSAGDTITSNQIRNDVKDANNNDVNDRVKAQISFLNKQMQRKLAEYKYEPEVVHNDPTSPLYSGKSFGDLRIPDAILKGIFSMGYQRPSRIQETMLPLLLASPHHNTIAQSQSGTGKTAAFLISSLERVDESLNYPQVLILSPTLELAMQTADVARKIAQFTKITIRNITKGEYRPKSEIVEHVLIGTPGKIVDWVFRFKSIDLKRIKVFVLDEADVMIDLQGHREQSIKIQQELDKDCQLLLFSATYDQAVLDFAECIISDPILVTLKKEEECLSNVRQFYSICANDDEKYIVVANIFGNVAIGSTIIFVKTRESAKLLKERLERDGHMVILLTGELTVEERLLAIKTFREGEQRVMITTNLTSRGIDIEQVTLVVNYDLPFDVFKKDVDFESYLHRIGRCGRFGKAGFAVSLIQERELEKIQKIEQNFCKTINLLKSEDEEAFKDWD